MNQQENKPLISNAATAFEFENCRQFAKYQKQLSEKIEGKTQSILV